MKISIIIFIFLGFVGLVLSLDPFYKQNNIDWKQFPPLYTNKDDHLLILDAREKFVLKRSNNGGIDWSLNVLDKNGNVIYGNQGYHQKNDNVMVVNFPSYGKTQISVSNDAGQSFTTSQVFPYKIVPTSAHLYVNGLVIGRSDRFILVSEDFGLTWNNASSKGDVLFTRAGSYIPTDPLWDPSEKTAVFLAILQTSTGRLGAFSVSKDMGKTFQTLINDAVDLMITDNFYYLITIGFKLYVKPLIGVAGATSTSDDFLLCQIPFDESILVNEIQILDDSSSAIFIGIRDIKDREYKNYGSVYVSNGAYNIFSLSVKYVSVSLDGIFDFIPLHGARGVFITNRVSNKDTLNPTATSFISYDNGGKWNRLTPPTDMPCTISDPCKLNVHGFTAFFNRNRVNGPVHSIANAPSLILATGNDNPDFSDATNKNEVKTVLSADFGQTWSKLFDEVTIYEFSNYGSSIIFASAMKDTKTFYYTFGLGLQPIAVNMKL
ncbi:hypothetical protein ACTFIU_002529 [Dictyostelium citrinum]